MKETAGGNFREFEAKCLHPGSPLKKKKNQSKGRRKSHSKKFEEVSCLLYW